LASSTVQHPIAALPSEYVLPGEGVHPEGVTFHGPTGRIYAGSSEHGTIYRGFANQSELEVFLEAGVDDRTCVKGMFVDSRGRLFVAGGPTGKVFSYDTHTGALLAAFDSGVDPTFTNDIIITPDGAVYITDSFSPVLYRVVDGAGGLELSHWLDLTDRIPYEDGFNLNGIVCSQDGRYLIVVQTNTGALYRIDTADGATVQIDVGGYELSGGDGMVLRGLTLYVVRNAVAAIAKVELAPDLASGTVVSNTNHPSFRFPTTAAELNGGRLAVVNSQFDQLGPNGHPVHPFTLSSVPLP
jgi:sugar lactone lactonase YvrE